MYFFVSTPCTIVVPPSPSSKSSSSYRAANSCDGSLSVYVYDLPDKFNYGLLQDCQHLNVYTDMCPHVANNGLGQPLLHMEDDGGFGSDNMNDEDGSTFSWFATHQFIAEMIFHARIVNHPCRTWEPSENSATLFYVPFYGGLHASSKFRESDLAKRDELAVELVEYLNQQSWWQRNQGRDHFLALGRTAWDFMRTDSGPDFGANSLLKLPHVKNMSVLTVERHPWQSTNQHGIPYPSYFHPSTSDEMLTWQNKMRSMDRPHLFSFVGAPRTGVEKAAIRDEILRQCSESSYCKMLKCGRVGASKCHNPKEVLKVMRVSRFCMQAPGDSFTRRSTFDSILAGCIPVFFSPHTAYTQYEWYLPKDPNEYSVYIPEKKWKQIEEELMKIPKAKVEKMRSAVIEMIPRITYIHPNATSGKDKNYPDAVDIALDQLSKHVMMINPIPIQ
ncbi:hypothetical protein MKW98_027550 [Papaver atlanticum]|uniref:Exostosin GT47 domain-containing protein n=1 Tax=Papaver atlanticum TaxID=357466 RepID=A0AAD4T4Z8_9MAGN|nr:hypothetical protein MKW98_027550 [Papaver atlanticum]